MQMTVEAVVATRVGRPALRSLHVAPPAPDPGSEPRSEAGSPPLPEPRCRFELNAEAGARALERLEEGAGGRRDEALEYRFVGAVILRGFAQNA